MAQPSLRTLHPRSVRTRTHTAWASARTCLRASAQQPRRRRRRRSRNRGRERRQGARAWGGHTNATSRQRHDAGFARRPWGADDTGAVCLSAAPCADYDDGASCAVQPAAAEEEGRMDLRRSRGRGGSRSPGAGVVRPVLWRGFAPGGGQPRTPINRSARERDHAKEGREDQYSHVDRPRACRRGVFWQGKGPHEESCAKRGCERGFVEARDRRLVSKRSLLSVIWDTEIEYVREFEGEEGVANESPARDILQTWARCCCGYYAHNLRRCVEVVREIFYRTSTKVSTHFEEGPFPVQRERFVNVDFFGGFFFFLFGSDKRPLVIERL